MLTMVLLSGYKSTTRHWSLFQAARSRRQAKRDPTHSLVQSGLIAVCNGLQSILP